MSAAADEIVSMFLMKVKKLIGEEGWKNDYQQLGKKLNSFVQNDCWCRKQQYSNVLFLTRLTKYYFHGLHKYVFCCYKKKTIFCTKVVISTFYFCYNVWKLSKIVDSWDSDSQDSTVIIILHKTLNFFPVADCFFRTKFCSKSR